MTAAIKAGLISYFEAFLFISSIWSISASSIPTSELLLLSDSSFSPIRALIVMIDKSRKMIIEKTIISGNPTMPIAKEIFPHPPPFWSLIKCPPVHVLASVIVNLPFLLHLNHQLPQYLRFLPYYFFLHRGLFVHHRLLQ